MNTNCLEGYKCPACGDDEEFLIRNAIIHTELYVRDDGTEEGDRENSEWEMDAQIRCESCQHEGQVWQFIEGETQPVNKMITIDVAGLIDGHGKRVKDIETARKAIEECIYSYMNDYLGEILSDSDCGVEDVED